jgi:FAD/FMN-containing dehydrogenase
MLMDSALQRLRSAVHGSVLTSLDTDYDTTRRIFNAMIDRRPAVIVRAAGVGDVVAAVRFAREHALAISVRGGGHSVAGTAVRDDGLMIDLQPMKAMRVDPEHRIAHAEPGLRLGEFDRATQAHGLATTLGVATDTGIAGLTLGGGLGWLNGKFGLACDNVRSFEVVTAEAQVLTVDAHRHEDLYWALRGGSGNFGVVTSFEYQLHSVGPIVLGGMIAFPWTRATEVLRVFLELSETAPDELSTVGALLTLPDGTPAVAVAICYCGPIEEGTKAVAPLRGLGAPLVDAIQALPYVAQQALLDDAFPPKGNFHYWKSSFTPSISDEGLEVVIDRMARKPSPLTMSYFQQLHGAAARVPVSATAFAHRGYRHDFAFLSQWSDPAATDANVQWTREAFAAMERHLEPGVYVNNLGDEGIDRVRAAFGANYDRLVAIKAKYDPTNVFRSTQNIEPRPAAVV